MDSLEANLFKINVRLILSNCRPRLTEKSFKYKVQTDLEIILTVQFLRVL